LYCDDDIFVDVVRKLAKGFGAVISFIGVPAGIVPRLPRLVGTLIAIGKLQKEYH
jgi:hypothetical protein